MRRGIGRAIAAALYAEGAALILTDKNEAAGRVAAADLGCRFERLDVAREGDLAALDLAMPMVDVVVINAGVTGFEDGPAAHGSLNATLEAWRALHRVNLDGTFLSCRSAIDAMRERGGGSIINMSSHSALVGVPLAAAHASSKAAVCNHAKSVALF